MFAPKFSFEQEQQFFLDIQQSIENKSFDRLILSQYKGELTELEKITSRNDWVIFTHLVIDHGRAICIANRPKCSECVISDFCPSSKN